MKTATASSHVAPAASYTCIWWNGGSHRGRWQPCAAGDREQAESHRAECARMGYLAKVVATASLRHGLPWTRLPEESVQDWTPGADGFLHKKA